MTSKFSDFFVTEAEGGTDSEEEDLAFESDEDGEGDGEDDGEDDEYEDGIGLTHMQLDNLQHQDQPSPQPEHKESSRSPASPLAAESMPDLPSANLMPDLPAANLCMYKEGDTCCRARRFWSAKTGVLRYCRRHALEVSICPQLTSTIRTYPCTGSSGPQE